MSLFLAILKELFGLFVDDGSLAIGILALVAVLAGATAIGLPPIVTGPLLFIACAALMAENIHRSLGAPKR